MDLAKYSKEIFRDLESGSPKLKRLLWELDRDVKSELHSVVLAKMEEIAKALNSVGHDLRPYEGNVAGSIDFLDGPDGNHALRLGCDTVISSGFRKTADCDANLEEESEWELEEKARGNA